MAWSSLFGPPTFPNGAYPATPGFKFLNGSTVYSIGDGGVVITRSAGDIGTYFNTGAVTVGQSFQFSFASTTNGVESGPDVGLGRTTVNVAKITDGSTGLGWLQDAGRSRITGDITNVTTTMANLTGLSATLIAGRSYVGKLTLFVSDSVAADGCKFDFDGGSATATDFRAMGRISDTVSIRALPMVTALATDIVDATTTGDAMVEIEFTITCNAAGTFIPRFAQNAHTTGTLTAFRGGKLELRDV